MFPRIVSAIAVAGLLVSCSNLEEEDPQASVLGLFENTYLNALYEFRPTLAARLGLRQYEGRLDTVTRLAINRRIDELKRQLVRLQNLREAELTLEERADAKLMDYRVRAELLELAHVARWRSNPEFYFQIPFQNLAYLVNRQFAPESERLRAAVVSLHEIGAVMAAMRGNVSETTPEFHDHSLLVAERLRRFLENELPLWAEDAAGVDMSLRGNFQAAAAQARDTLDVSIEWVRNDLASRQLGASALGSETFVMKLLFEEMLAIPLAELINIGEENIERDHDAFVQYVRRIDAAASPRQVLRRLTAQTVPESELLQTTTQMVDAAYRALGEYGDIPVPPDSRITVALAPLYLRDGYVPVRIDLPGPGAERVTGTETEEPRRGILLLSPPSAELPGPVNAALQGRLNQWDLQLAALYEAVPGRYVKASYGLQNASRPRHIVSARSAIDGWASYVEGLMLERGFGGGSAELQLCHLRRRLVESCRLLASVRYHTQGMTLAAAERLFIEKAYLETEVAHREALEAVYDPTYFVGLLGRLEIENLRDDYREYRGASFNLRTFHEEFLSTGPIPIPLARQLLLSGPQPGS